MAISIIFISRIYRMKEHFDARFNLYSEKKKNSYDVHVYERKIHKNYDLISLIK